MPVSKVRIRRLNLQAASFKKRVTNTFVDLNTCVDIFFKLLIEVKHIDRKGLQSYAYSSVNIHKFNSSLQPTPRSRSNISDAPEAPSCLLSSTLPTRELLSLLLMP